MALYITAAGTFTDFEREIRLNAGHRTSISKSTLKDMDGGSIISSESRFTSF